MNISSESCAELIKSGQILMRDGKHEEAISAFTQANDLQPDSFWAKHHAGEAYASLERWEQAVESFQAAIAVDGKNFGTHFKLANALMHLQRWSDAIESLQRAAEIDPKNLWPLIRIGDALSRMDRLTEAAALYQQVIEREPTNLAALSGLCKASQGMPPSEELINALRLAVDANPQEFWPVFRLGEAYEQLGHWEKALETFQRAVALNETGFGAHFKLGDVLTQLQRWPEAVESLRLACELDPENVWARARLGEAFAMSGREEEAMVAFAQVIERDPKNVAALHGLNVLSEAVDTPDQSLEKLEIPANAGPDEFLQMFGLARGYFHSQQWDNAIVSLQQTIALCPTFSPALEMLGEVHIKLDQLDKAEESFRKALEISPTAPAIDGLRRVLKKQGRTGDTTIDTITRALIHTLVEDTKYTPGYDLLGAIFEQEDQLEAAKAIYRKAASHDAANEDIKRRLAALENS